MYKLRQYGKSKGAKNALEEVITGASFTVCFYICEGLNIYWF